MPYVHYPDELKDRAVMLKLFGRDKKDERRLSSETVAKIIGREYPNVIGVDCLNEKTVRSWVQERQQQLLDQRPNMVPFRVSVDASPDRDDAYDHPAITALVSMIGQVIKLVTAGIKVDEYRPDDTTDEVEIRVRYPSEVRTIKQLDRIRVPTEKGMVPLSNFVKRSAKPRVGTVNRVDGKRVFWVKADLVEGVQADVKVDEIEAWLKTAKIDPRVGVEFKGEDEEQRKAKAFLSKAFLIALFIIAIILVTQFNSFYSSLLILSAVIMSTVGVFIGLLITGQPFGIVMSGVGVIALAGIVVNNNIVLIDTFDRIKRNIKDPMEAILRTGAQRMRPVLLTTMTTILGLLPMVFGVNIDFVTREVAIGAPSTQWWTQLSTAIVFGLGFATILTLLVTPASLMIRANVQAWRVNRKKSDGSFESSPEAVEAG